MNKKVLLGVSLASVALVSAAYSGTAWYAGKQVESQIKLGIEELAAANPLLTIATIGFKRGLFRTEHEMTMGFNPDCLGGGLANTAAMPKELEQMTLRLRHTVAHGPLAFLNGVQPGLAAYQGEFVFDKETVQELRKVLGDQPVLSWTGVIQFNGKHHFRVHSPAFDVKDKGAHVTWAGMSGTGSGNMHERSYQLQLQAPKLTMDAVELGTAPIGQALLENMQVVLEGREGKSKIGIGSGTFSIGKLEMADPKQKEQLALSQISYSADIKEAGDFVDLQLAYKIAGVVLGVEQQKKYGPIVLEMALEHLHAPTVLQFGKSVNKILCAKPDQQAALMETMQQWKEMAVTLLQNDPVFHLKQVKLGASEGEIQFTGKVGLHGFQPAMLADLQSAMSGLPAVLQVELEGRATEKMVTALLRENAASRARQEMMLTKADDLPPAQVQALHEHAEAGAKQQLQMALGQNLIRQEADQLNFSFRFRQGQARLNGDILPLPFLPNPDRSALALTAAGEAK